VALLRDGCKLDDLRELERTPMRNLVYYVACTVDGFIAREDGSFDCFLSEGEHFADLISLFPETFPGHMRAALGVSGPNQRFDAVLMGRSTYAVGADHGFTNPYPSLQQYVVSSSMAASPDPAVTLVKGDPADLVRSLKRQPGRDIWLCGGGQLAASLVGEIDQLILKVNPVIIGAGIPLFGAGFPPAGLALTASKAYPNGVLLLDYAVSR
jgi:dihydrofolate reductase